MIYTKQQDAIGSFCPDLTTSFTKITQMLITRDESRFFYQICSALSIIALIMTNYILIFGNRANQCLISIIRLLISTLTFCFGGERETWHLIYV